MIASIEYGCRPPAAYAGASADAPAFTVNLPGYRRDESSTFFAFPERYIVYAAEDFGNYVATGDDSGFHWFAAVAGYWRSVCNVRQAAHAPPPTDVGAMMYAAGVGFSIEYIVRGLYETTIGRLTEWWRADALTAEDRLAHQVALDYAKFRYRKPWYRYPFWTRLEQLWVEVPMRGPAQPRKWERRVALSLEYAAKAASGTLIQAAIGAGGDEGVRDVMFVVRDLRPDDVSAEPRSSGSPISAAAPRWCARRARASSPRSRWRSPAPAASSRRSPATAPC